MGDRGVIMAEQKQAEAQITEAERGGDAKDTWQQ
jgi:hypothetical protein